MLWVCFFGIAFTIGLPLDRKLMDMAYHDIFNGKGPIEAYNSTHIKASRIFWFNAGVDLFVPQHELAEFNVLPRRAKMEGGVPPARNWLFKHWNITSTFSQSCVNVVKVPQVSSKTDRIA